MKINLAQSPPTFKIAVKVAALGVSLVALTYGLVWFLLSTLRFFVEGVFP